MHSELSRCYRTRNRLAGRSLEKWGGGVVTVLAWLQSLSLTRIERGHYTASTQQHGLGTYTNSSRFIDRTHFKILFLVTGLLFKLTNPFYSNYGLPARRFYLFKALFPVTELLGEGYSSFRPRPTRN